jgi:predicted RNA-binding Zn-ribbon protein involved in translation (DUF1610 family)
MNQKENFRQAMEEDSYAEWAINQPEQPDHIDIGETQFDCPRCGNLLERVFYDHDNGNTRNWLVCTCGYEGKYNNIEPGEWYEHVYGKANTITLVTDWEGDGYFLPYILADRPEELSEQDIDDALYDAGVGDVFTWWHLEWSENNNCWYPRLRL